MRHRMQRRQRGPAIRTGREGAGAETKVAPDRLDQVLAVAGCPIERLCGAEPPLDEESVAEATGRRREPCLMQQARDAQLALALASEAREFHKPGPARGMSEELAPLLLDVGGRPLPFGCELVWPPSSSGDVIERALERADQVRDPGRKPVLR